MAYVGATPDDLAALKPEAFFIGHAHFDHAGDLPTVIESNPEMAVVGTQEHCNDLALVAPGANCMAVFAAGAPLGATADLSDLIAGVEITAVKQPHSTPMVNPADPPFAWPSPCAPIAEFAPDPDDPLSWQGLTGGFVAVAYQFRVGELAVMWQDTAGPIAGTAVTTAFANLPPTDVRLGSVVVAGRSVLNQHLSVLQPDLFVPLHGDPCFANVNAMVKQHIEDTIPRRERPQVRYLSDPDDFLDPMTFLPWSPRWRD
jgi:hypothetical protein